MQRAIILSILSLLLLCSTTQLMAQSDAPKAKTALVLIDIQEFYFPGGMSELENPLEAAEKAEELLQFFRVNNWPVIHIGHNAKEQQDFYPPVSPDENEYILMKDKVNAFASGELDKYLKREGITHLVICGMQTHMCVEAATRAASDLGYNCTLVSDACATKNLMFGDHSVPALEVHQSTLATLSGVYAKVLDTSSLIAVMQP